MQDFSFDGKIENFFNYVLSDFFLCIVIIVMPIPLIMIPATKISIPYKTQSEFAYIKDDSGPILDFPWKWKIIPKIAIIVPKNKIRLPSFILFYDVMLLKRVKRID